MAITKDGGRQWPLVASVDFTYADLTADAAVAAVDVPYGAKVIGGHVEITTAFNSGTSDALAVGDGTTTFASVSDAQSTGSTLFSAMGPVFTSPDTIDITWSDEGTAATAGAGTLYVTYIIDGRATEVQPV